MITFKHKGDFKKTIGFLDNLQNPIPIELLKKYGEEGKRALSNHTPKDSGLTAQSWHYKIQNGKKSASISFYNSNYNDGVPIAIILQYGHGTKNGGYVRGKDYINPAIQPLFNKMVKEIWKEVVHE